MNQGVRMSLAVLGPVLTILFIAMSKERPLSDTVQLLSVSFGVSGVALAVGFFVYRRRGAGVASVALTTAVGVAMIWAALIVTAVFNPQVRGWLPILIFTAPAFTFPSIFGAALATCAGRATSSSPSQTASGSDPAHPA